MHSSEKAGSSSQQESKLSRGALCLGTFLGTLILAGPWMILYMILQHTAWDMGVDLAMGGYAVLMILGASLGEMIAHRINRKDWFAP